MKLKVKKTLLIMLAIMLVFQFPSMVSAENITTESTLINQETIESTINSNDGISLEIDAAQNEGVYSPYIMGNMFEWASDYMNGTWAQRVSDRNFETDSVARNSSSLYDAFLEDSLDRSKWTPYTFGGTSTGSYQILDSNLVLTGTANVRYGLLSRAITNNVQSDVTIKVELVSYSGSNAMISLMPLGSTSFDNNIEFGIDDGKLKIFGDGIDTYVGPETIAPVTLKIEVGHLKGATRDIRFYANDTLIHTVNDFTKLGEQYNLFLYGWSNSVTEWKSVSIYANDLYEHFDGTPTAKSFFPVLLGGDTTGTVTYENSKAIISGGQDSRYGIMSSNIASSSVDWVGVEAKLDAVSGTNALIHLTNDETKGFTDFIEYGVEDGTLRVYTPSGNGNWVGQSVSYPCTLRIETSPYYANGRNIRFFYNNTLVYALWENDELPADDYRVCLYGYDTSVTQWDWVKIYNEHFTEVAGPNFEGGSLPNDWEISSLNGGAYGTIDSHDGFCTIHGAADSRYGVGLMAFENSDISSYRVVAKLDSVSGVNGLIHLTTAEPHEEFSDFVEFGVEDGKLHVFTPTASWEGPSVTLPARLSIETSPYSSDGRDIVFLCNGEPVYVLEDCTALENKEYRAFIYGYGTSSTVWDYLDGYPLDSWQTDGYDAWGGVSQDNTQETKSGQYMEKISILSSDEGKLGLSQGGIDVIAGHEYEVSVWLKQSGNISSVHISLGENISESPDKQPYAQTSITNIGSTLQKYTVTLTPTMTDIDAKLFLGACGTGDLWVDQISVMPLHSSEVAYGGWRKDFVDALIALNPKALRWPGGILSDWYYWDDGVGERDSRPPLYFAQWNASWMNNDVGVDEFLQLCEALEIDPVLNVNYAIGSDSYAADFVEYVNGDIATVQGQKRAANGRTDSYDIVTWEIGNETWGSWVPNPESASSFSNGYTQYYTAMKEVDSSIRCIGEGGDGNSYDQSWNQTMITSVADKLDEISIHYYSPQHLPVNYSDYEVYKASVSAPVSVKERMDATQALISESGYDIKLAITEYNAMYFHSLRHRTRSMEAALQVAGLLNAFMEYPGLTDHNDYSCLAQFWDGSCIRLGNRGIFTTPAYDVLSLYSNKRGEMKIHSEMSSPVFSNIQIGNVPQMENVPTLEALVTRNMTGSKIYISLLNRSDSTGYDIPISIQNATVATSASVYTVAANHYLDANSWQEPDKISCVQSTITNAGNSFTYHVPKLSVTVIELDVSDLQTISGPILCGVIKDSAGNRLAGVTVSIQDSTEAVTTDENGYFEIEVEPGTYTVVCQKDGLQDEIMQNIYVYDGAGTMSQPIVMQ